MDKCEKKVKPEYKEVDSLKQKIDTIKIDVVRWKEAKAKIKYRTKFDTLTKIDTVLLNLRNCDTIVKIDSIIIHKQDTIIQFQEDIIYDLDSYNQELESEKKKIKRKLFFTKVLAGVVIILTIIATR